jgi:protein-tyrosine phosphatase
VLKRLYLIDVGGETTGDGGQVRTGLLYRSSGLHRLRTTELAYVRSLGLRHIIDLREPNATTRHPDLMRAEVMTHLPMELAALENLRARDVLMRRVNVNALFHTRLYADTLENHGHSIRSFLDLLLEKPTPALVHCTAGKDRTGMMVAMFYLALGVPRERVLGTYMAIMPHLQQYFPRRLKALVQVLGGPPLAYSVIQDYMEGMLDHLDHKYGGPLPYLQSIGFTQTALLRERFLE